MKVLVTGGAGFIGSHTVERLLAQGAEVGILDNFNDYYAPDIKRHNISAVQDRITLVEGDLRDPEVVERAFAEGKYDAVIHLAARAGVRPSIEQPELYIDTNIKGTFYLLEACKRHGVKKFVFASSSSVYGVNKKVPFAEEDPILQTISLCDDQDGRRTDVLQLQHSVWHTLCVLALLHRLWPAPAS
ncbi:SDR family NAD(P)-dependent oxidoreductase [Verrucomicrobium spinosum]|uniref:SDR family NAD(P)-dependent oxidoreductase n=1 Tax=Verrucomicrobium spinosum TaxID=2736 RepID=UPI000A677717|nr:SDR family NAD(P)-dependent oxidoreductase [Verrucomicrobium spinosum]